MGLSTSQATKLFAQVGINHGGLPLEVRVVQPNATTLAAMKELDEGRGHRAEGVEQLLEDLMDGKVRDA